MPRDPEVFGHPTRTEIIERAAQHVRDGSNVRKRHAADRIEVDRSSSG
jgi:hypothetical protein